MDARSPPTAVTVPGLLEAVEKLNRASTLERGDSIPGVVRARENASKGPAKSSSSTSSKRRMARFFKRRSPPSSNRSAVCASARTYSRSPLCRRVRDPSFCARQR